jgi:hypothetical protein
MISPKNWPEDAVAPDLDLARMKPREIGVGRRIYSRYSSTPVT